MIGDYNRYNKIVDKIEFKMLRKNDNCWIKAEPISRVSSPSSLFIILNDEKHHWDIFDEKGNETYKVYFSNPFFIAYVFPNFINLVPIPLPCVPGLTAMYSI